MCWFSDFKGSVAPALALATTSPCSSRHGAGSWLPPWISEWVGGWCSWNISTPPRKKERNKQEQQKETDLVNKERKEMSPN